jgi:flagellin-like hook-associated protein FlgL
MLNLSQSAVDGRFIFTGDDDTKAAYSQDFTAANGVTRLSSAPVTRQFEHPAGGSFLSGLSAQDIFDHRNPDDSLATDNVFAALNSLRTALLNGDVAALHTAADSIKSGTDHLNTSVSFYGNTQTRIEDATNYAATYDVRIQIEISQKEEADLVSAALASTQVNTQLQAAFQMRSKMTRNSLFDYLG